MGKKVKTSVALDSELLAWLDSQVKTRRFATRTHAIEYLVQKDKEEHETPGVDKELKER